ncbi:SIMPL domain-containing protein [Caminicella sporogenes]|uniref:SIMPL domain-containing protein n=1 Tax=Caminicella sporogenes TaxID=166485 RepID=UPI002541D7DC|nr:SIMPL domain-containing protein [Caminicella sporogenes]WIF94396.1 SIMPL domain-containing protein [Caminicella sporogenes]
MKRIFYGFIILSLVVGLFVLDSHDLLIKEASAESISNEEKDLLTVYGIGTIKVKPDIAYVDVGVETFNENARKAQLSNADIMNKVVEELKKAGINKEDIKTNTFNIYKTVKYESKENRIEGYNVINIIKVTVRDVKKVGQIIDAANRAGANRISNIRFSVADEKNYYKKALKLAMQDASGKASAILDTFGAKADKPYSITEDSYGGGAIYRESTTTYSNDMLKSFAATPIEANELEITARVVVKYKY